MSLMSLSPLDGRYRSQTAGLAGCLSEWALIRYRVHMEIEWLLTMSEWPEIACVRPFSEAERQLLRSWIASFDEAEAGRVKEIEQTTRHDVKAVEYYLKERLAGTSLADVSGFVHFCCTSEDINNLAYGVMLRHAVEQEWLPAARRLVESVVAMAEAARDTPLLSRTHGQPASPSTVGKELAVFVYRWQRQLEQLGRIEYLGKFNGTVGSYNTHAIAYPDAPWLAISRGFVERLGLAFNPLTTQIEPHDGMAELFHLLMRFNTITLDFDRDVWSYISLGYFRQRVVAQEVGSSTMPHKVNPIDFENSEANLGISSALLDHLAGKLPVSRLQRDLSDSSAQRNIGAAIGHSLLALQSALRGVQRLQVDHDALQRDLEGAWEVLAEAVQIVMKKNGCPDAYEQLKELTRGAAITREAMQAFIRGLEIPEAEKTRLLALTPATYTGLAAQLVGCADQPGSDGSPQ
jgi:adenylosuccinate lyase